MSVIDILFRVDEICRKYDKYDVEKHRQLAAYGDDAFARLFSAVQSDIDSALHVRSSLSLSSFLFFFFGIWKRFFGTL